MKIIVACLPFAIAAAASDRIEIRNGILPAPGAQHCVRLHATGNFERAEVRVNDVAAGELGGPDSELDITGYTSPGSANTIQVEPRKGRVTGLWSWISPPVYIASARLRPPGALEVTIVNTSENTAQVDIAEHQFTVSPGTSLTRQFDWPHGRLVRMHAVSDGLDREFMDEMEASPVEHR